MALQLYLIVWQSVEVIEPEYMRKIIAERMRQALKLYECVYKEVVFMLMKASFFFSY